MSEILLHALDREHLLNERFSGNGSGAFGYLAFKAIFRVNLSDPAGITVTGRTDADLWMKAPEMESLQIGIGNLGHDFILDEKKGLPNSG